MCVAPAIPANFKVPDPMTSANQIHLSSIFHNIREFQIKLGDWNYQAVWFTMPEMHQILSTKCYHLKASICQ